MASLLSLFSSCLTSVDLYTQLYDCEEFVKFVALNHGKNPSNILNTFTHNLLIKLCDPYADQVINNSEMEQILLDTNMDKITRIKLYIGKAALHYHDSYLSDDDHIIIESSALIDIVVRYVSLIIIPDQVNSGLDIYNQLINIVTNLLCSLAKPQLKYFLNHDITRAKHHDYRNTIAQIIQLLDTFNSICEYNSPFIQPNNSDSDDHDCHYYDSDNDNSNNGNVDNDNDNNNNNSTDDNSNNNDNGDSNNNINNDNDNSNSNNNINSDNDNSNSGNDNSDSTNDNSDSSNDNGDSTSPPSSSLNHHNSDDYNNDCQYKDYEHPSLSPPFSGITRRILKRKRHHHSNITNDNKRPRK